MVAYGVSPRTIQLIHTYWGHLTIVSRDGGYFRMPFKGYYGITQGNPLSPPIFNAVVDAVIHYWVSVLAPTEDGTEVLGLSIHDLAS